MLMGMVLRTTQHTLACTLHQTYVYLLGMVMNTQTMVLVLGMVMNTDHGTFMEHTMLYIKALNLFGSRGVE